MTAVRLPTIRMGGVRTEPESRWRDDALCQKYDPEIFFPIGRGLAVRVQEREAVAICRQCPVVSRCLQWALAGEPVMGVWGATTEDERAALIRNRTQKRNR